MKKRTLGIYILVIIFANSTFAQSKKTKQIRSPKQELSYTDKNYLTEIKSVEFYNSEKEQSFPLIHLGTNDLLHLSFDDLRADIRTFYFSFEHCDIQWKKSNLSPLEYSSGYGEEQIKNISSSLNTLQTYTHYQIQFPTENTKPLLSGNYLLKVYEDADKSRLILSRRFHVLDEKMTVEANVVPSMEIKNRKAYQKVEVTVNTQKLAVNNPIQDIKVMVMQNNRQDIQQWEGKPSIIRDNILFFNHPNQFNFEGGQEFLYADIRSFRLQSSMIKEMQVDTSIRLELIEDKYLNNTTYSEVTDENGRFYIRNLDHQEQPEVLGDYAELTFTLNSFAPQNSEIYLLGAFNNFNRSEENKMKFDKNSQTWKIKKFLKQGVYDYLYVSDSIPSFYETKNIYQIIIYYRNPRLNRDEIVGFHEINSFL